MAEFTYKAVNAAGEELEGSMEARSREAVVERLHGMDYIPIKVEDSSPLKNRSPTTFQWFNSNRISQTEVGSVTRELAILLQAGLPLDRSLEILISLTEIDRIEQLLIGVREEVQGGSTLSDALDARNETFSRFYVSMVRAGEAGGALGPVLVRISEFMERSKALRETVTSALIYPAILVIISVLSVIMLLMFVVPQFSVMFEQSGKALPTATQVVISVGDFLAQAWWLLLIACWGLFEFMRRQMANPDTRYKWDALLLRIPLVKDLITKIEVTRFSRSLGILMGNGVTLLNALTIIRDTVSNLVLAEGLDVIREKLKQGHGLGQPMQETGLYPSFSVQMIIVGEETGRLEEMLLKVADVYDDEVENAVKRLLSLMEPILILGLGLMVGGIIMSILVAILSINDLAF
jgi:general secretion pathway protein F